MSERVEVLEIDLTEVQNEATETSKTLKDLRGEVKELRQTLENTAIGTEEFSNTLGELTKKQQELTNVTKSGVAAQKGSYNDLVNQMAILKKEWRSTADEAERTALGEKILDINNRLKEMDATVGNHQREVGNYRQILKGLKEELLDLEEGTAEYNAKLAEAAEISQKMQDVNEFIAASAQDLGDHMQNVAGAAAGISGAFQTVQATLNLVGVESEGVTKMIAKMQNVMAITNGLKAIEGSVDAFKRLSVAVKGSAFIQNLLNKAKVEDVAVTEMQTTATVAQTVATKTATVATKALKAALISTGVGALVVALGSLVSWLTSTSEEAEDASSSIDKMNESFTRAKRNLDWHTNRESWVASKQFVKEIEEAGNDAVKLQEAITKRNHQLSETHINNLKRDMERIEKEHDAAGEEWRRYLDMLNSDIDYEGVDQELVDQYFEIYNNKGHELQEAQAKYWGALADAAMEGAETVVDAHQKQLEKEKEELKKQQEERKKFLTESLKSEEDFIKAKTKVLEELSQLEFDTTQSADLKSGQKDKFDVEIAELERELGEKKQVYKEYYETILKDEKGNEKDRLLSAEQYNQAIANLESLYGDKISDVRLEKEKETNDKIIAEREEVRKQIDKINEKILKDLASSYRKQDISNEINAREGNNVQMYKNLQQILDAEKVAYETQKQSLIQLKEELLQQNKDVSDVNLALAENADAITMNAELLKTAIASQKSAELESVAQTISGVQDSLDLIMSLELGSQLGEEFNIAFTAIQEGLSQTSELLKTGKSEWVAYGKMAASGLNAAANILTTIASKQDKETEEGFEKQKKLQIAAATMAMLGGVVSAISSAFNPANAWMTIYGQSAAAGIMSSLVLTSGIMQINQIKKQKFDGESSATTSSPALTALQMIDTGVQATTNIDGASVESQVTDTRVYVVESDITNSQRVVRTTVSEATF